MASRLNTDELHKLFNNAVNKYGDLCGICVKKYIFLDRKEKELIKELYGLKISSNLAVVNPDYLSAKSISFVSNILAAIQYQKKYFANQLVMNRINMDFIVKYLNWSSKNNVDLTTISSYSDRVEELPDKPSNPKKGGASSIIYLLKLCVFVILFNSITNSTSTADALSDPYSDIGVSLILHDVRSQLKARSNIVNRLSVTNPKEMQEYALQFARPDTVWPESQNIVSGNLTSLFLPAFLDQISAREKKTLLGWLKTNREAEFNEFIKQETDKLNIYIKLVYKSLNRMCKTLVDVVEDKLPIELYELYNRELQVHEDTILDVEEKVKLHKEENVRSSVLKEIGDVDVEPSTSEVIYETVTNMVDITKYFYSSPPVVTNQVSTEVKPPKQKVSASELKQIYENVEKQVITTMASKETTQEITSETRKIVENAIQTKLWKEAIDKTSEINRKVYFGSLCSIAFGNIPHYVAEYNSTNNQMQLYIKDNAESRFHIEIMVNNVLSYYDKIVSDVRDSEMRDKLTVLHEKSQFLQSMFADYDVSVIQSIMDTTATNVEEYFGKLNSTWEAIKENAVIASMNYPMQFKAKQSELKRLEEQNIRDIEEQNMLNEMEVQSRIAELMRRRKNNNITEDEWEQHQIWLKSNAKGVFGSAENILNAAVNSTGNIGENLVFNIRSVGNGVMGIVWMILLGSCVLFIPAIGCIAIRSGAVGAYFKSYAKKKNAAAATEPAAPKPPAISATQLTNPPAVPPTPATARPPRLELPVPQIANEPAMPPTPPTARQSPATPPTARQSPATPGGNARRYSPGHNLYNVSPKAINNNSLVFTQGDVREIMNVINSHLKKSTRKTTTRSKRVIRSYISTRRYREKHRPATI